jgi:ParB/RepB/Spo0J family partition protein
MNANAPAPQIVVERLPLAQVVPSTTHIQELRRSRFDKHLIGELAESLKTAGQLQPILVRRSQANGRADKFEIVAGERRWLAAKAAGLATVDATVRSLSDEQVLEIQLIENLQRTDLHALEEAEGYEELMKLKGVPAEDLGAMVGKSESYVRARVKLLALCEDARKSFYAGEMDASTALLIARIPHGEHQKRAMRELAEQRQYGDVSNYKEAQAFIRDNFMLKLKEAPFDPKDGELVPAAGSCQACPKRSGNQADLFGDGKEKELCTDARCFDSKVEAFHAVAVAKLEAQGKSVIHGEAAKKILPNWRENSGAYLQGGYVPLDEHSYDLGGKVRSAMPAGFVPTLIQHPGTGKIIEAASSQAVTKAKLARGIKSRAGGGSGYNYEAAERRAKAKGPDVDTQLTEYLARMIHEKAPKVFTRKWLQDLAAVFHSRLNLRDDEAVAKSWGWPARSLYGSHKLPKQAEKLDERGLVLLMFDMAFATGQWDRKDVLKLFGIDEDKVREQVIADRKAAAQKAREDAKAKKAEKSNVAKVNAAIDKRSAKAKKK